MAQITVTRALSELGTIQDRIQRAISTGVFVSVVKGVTEKPSNAAYTTATDLRSTMTASFDTVESLIARQARLKAAVIISNAATKVIISGKEMTVAEAIDQKNIAQCKTSFLSTLKSQLVRCNTEVQTAQVKMDEQIERATNSLYAQGKDKVTPEQYAAVATPIKNDFQPKIVSSKPDLNAYIRSFEAELNEFMSQCDYVLSESNCQTLIDVI